MTLEVQFKIKNNPYYLRYLRENSYWYKILNRSPNSFIDFERKVKEEYKLRKSDKINRALQTFEMLESVLSTLK